MKAELEKALAVLKPSTQAGHTPNAAWSELQTSIERMEQQISATQGAVLYTLDRIRRDEALRFQCGEGSETFRLLVNAAAILLDQPPEAVKAYVYGEGVAA